MELHKDTSGEVHNCYTSPDQPGKLYTKNEPLITNQQEKDIFISSGDITEVTVTE